MQVSLKFSPSILVLKTKQKRNKFEMPDGTVILNICVIVMHCMYYKVCIKAHKHW